MMINDADFGTVAVIVHSKAVGFTVNIRRGEDLICNIRRFGGLNHAPG